MRSTLVLCALFVLLSATFGSALSATGRRDRFRLHTKVETKATASQPAASDDVASFLYAVEQKDTSSIGAMVTDDVIGCIYKTTGVACYESSAEFLNVVGTFINGTGLIMISPTAFFPPNARHYSCAPFVLSGFYAKSLTSFSADTIAVAQVNSANQFERYFELNDLSSVQSNHTAMKQVLVNLYEHICNDGLNSTEALLAGDFEGFLDYNGHVGQFTNISEWANGNSGYFQDRVPGSCHTYIERIGVAGNYVFAKRHSMWALDLGPNTGDTVERGVDILYLTTGSAGSLVVSNWYIYAHRRHNSD